MTTLKETWWQYGAAVISPSCWLLSSPSTSASRPPGRGGNTSLARLHSVGPTRDRGRPVRAATNAANRQPHARCRGDARCRCARAVLVAAVPRLWSVLARGHGLGVRLGLVCRTAGIWGPIMFCGAAVLAARRQPGYSHRSHHISGLAARGERSATVMVPGFLVLGLSSAVMPVTSVTVRRLARMAGFATIVAGLVPASAPRCPQPFVDPEATASDVGHGVASLATFALWTAMPIVAFRQCQPGWFRSLSGALSLWTVTGFVSAGATRTDESAHSGLAQRAFLGGVFAWYGATTIADLAQG